MVPHEKERRACGQESAHGRVFNASVHSKRNGGLFGGVMSAPLRDLYVRMQVAEASTCACCGLHGCIILILSSSSLLPEANSCPPLLEGHCPSAATAKQSIIKSSKEEESL